METVCFKFFLVFSNKKRKMRWMLGVVRGNTLQAIYTDEAVYRYAAYTARRMGKGVQAD